MRNHRYQYDNIYSDPEQARQDKEESDADIRGKIEQIRVEFSKSRISPTSWLPEKARYQGWRNSTETNFEGIKPVYKAKEKIVVTTQSDHDELIYPNLLQEMSIIISIKFGRLILLIFESIMALFFWR